MRFNNQLAVITGGNSGIGRAIAEQLIAEGARVVILGRNPKTLEATQQALGESCFTYPVDVSDTQALKTTLQQVHQEHGKLDLLVANAGGYGGGRRSLDQVDEAFFDQLFNTNVRGLYFTVKYGSELMNSGGAILLVASIAGHINSRSHSVYSTTKAATLKLTQQFANDLAEKNIRVNSISPGYTQTPLFDDQLDKNPDFLKERAAIIPLKRIGQPQDMAHAALFLCSPEASYITGADLIVDGGLCATFGS